MRWPFLPVDSVGGVAWRIALGAAHASTDRHVKRVHADRAAPVDAKLPQAAEDFLDTLACKISLDQVAARLASRAREHHEVGRPPLAAQYPLYPITEISRAHDPYMQQRHAR